MTGALFLAIDVGTTAVKLGLIDGAGRLLNRVAEGYPTRRPRPGRAEQDPADWCRLIDAGIAALLHEADGDRIAAVGLCSQVNTHVFAGADGRPLRPAILWQDTRAAPEAARLDAGADDAAKTAWWGAPMPIDASSVLARMAWVAAHEPEIWARTRHVLLPKDVCIRHLTGDLATDPLSNIGLVGPDLAYADGAADLVPGARDRRAPLVRPTEVAGRVRAGPLAGVPVVCGTMDAWAGLVGTGAGAPGTAAYLSGTSEILGAAADAVTGAPGAVVFAPCEGLRLHAAPTQSGGDAATWFREAADLTPDAMEAVVAGAPRGASTPLFLPQLEGERAPLWDAGLRGAFVGLTRATGRADLARAVYEGVALSARHALGAVLASSDLALERLACAGGGFRAPAWAQIRADVLGAPCHLLEGGEPGLLGAAMIAAVGLGAEPDLAAARAATMRHGATFAPDPRRAALYDDLFGLYVEAVAANARTGRRLSGIARAHGGV